jgi:hypothetical protein
MPKKKGGTQMPPLEPLKTKIAIDDVVESAAHGVLRALEARDLGRIQVDRHGFVVDLIIRVGGRRFDEVIRGLNTGQLGQ